MSSPSPSGRFHRFVGAVRSALATVANADAPTLDALRKISRTLHEAGCGTPRASRTRSTPTSWSA